MVYTFGRISAVLGLDIGDYYQNGRKMIFASPRKADGITRCRRTTKVMSEFFLDAVHTDMPNGRMDDDEQPEERSWRAWAIATWDEDPGWPPSAAVDHVPVPKALWDAYADLPPPWERGLTIIRTVSSARLGRFAMFIVEVAKRP